MIKNIFLLGLKWSFEKSESKMWVRACQCNLKVMDSPNGWSSEHFLVALMCKREKVQLDLYNWGWIFKTGGKILSNCCELCKGNVKSLTNHAWALVQLLSAGFSAKTILLLIFAFFLPTFSLSSSNIGT